MGRLSGIPKVRRSSGIHSEAPANSHTTCLLRLVQVKPHRSNKFINLSFHGTNPGKHTGFVHVRTDVDTLVIPVEVHVIKGGIHRLPELLDFETLTSAKARKEVTLSLLNSTPLPV